MPLVAMEMRSGQRSQCGANAIDHADSHRPPFPLPRNVEVPIYFTIPPGGAYLSTPGPGPRGAWLVYPNYTQEFATCGQMKSRKC